MKKKYPECKAHPFSLEEGFTMVRLGSYNPSQNGVPDTSIFNSIEPYRKRELLIDAAKKGNNRAIWMIAAGYQSGWWGFPVDKMQSMKWYGLLIGSWKKDAENGDAKAAEVLNFLDGLKKE